MSKVRKQYQITKKVFRGSENARENAPKVRNDFPRLGKCAGKSEQGRKVRSWVETGLASLEYKWYPPIRPEPTKASVYRSMYEEKGVGVRS